MKGITNSIEVKPRASPIAHTVRSKEGEVPASVRTQRPEPIEGIMPQFDTKVPGPTIRTGGVQSTFQG